MDMKTRLQFLAGLLGIGTMAKAQDAISCAGSPEFCDPLKWRGTKNALANQCPVCGTMAEVFKSTTHFTALHDCKGIPNQKYLAYCEGGKEVKDVIERVVRCKRCNAAFWQDSE